MCKYMPNVPGSVCNFYQLIEPCNNAWLFRWIDENTKCIQTGVRICGEIELIRGVGLRGCLQCASAAAEAAAPAATARVVGYPYPFTPVHETLQSLQQEYSHSPYIQPGDAPVYDFREFSPIRSILDGPESCFVKQEALPQSQRYVPLSTQWPYPNIDYGIPAQEIREERRARSRDSSSPDFSEVSLPPECWFLSLGSVSRTDQMWAFEAMGSSASVLVELEPGIPVDKGKAKVQVEGVADNGGGGDLDYDGEFLSRETSLNMSQFVNLDAEENGKQREDEAVVATAVTTF